jgi:hypothetical protein
LRAALDEARDDFLNRSTLAASMPVSYGHMASGSKGPRFGD